MGKVVDRVRLSSLLDPAKSLEIDALIDTGAAMLALPQNVINQLGLRKIDEVKVRYIKNQCQQKSIYAGLLLEMKGRRGNFSALAEEEGAQALIGQIVLEQLDLVVDPVARTVGPNPRSPNMPQIDLL